ncbi:MAG: hypothetical protein GDA50_08415 [Alphaproteobacteria bacterium GM202ARS2]|nr:hypothetical protein [Alphaproteobacteria bacterium GM202ARS2]
MSDGISISVNQILFIIFAIAIIYYVVRSIKSAIQRTTHDQTHSRQETDNIHQASPAPRSERADGIAKATIWSAVIIAVATIIAAFIMRQ